MIRSVLILFGIWVVMVGITLAMLPWVPIDNNHKNSTVALCHTCLCNEHAEKCVRDCGSDGMCKVLCAHECNVQNGGKGICPIPKK